MLAQLHMGFVKPDALESLWLATLLLVSLGVLHLEPRFLRLFWLVTLLLAVVRLPVGLRLSPLFLELCYEGTI